MSIQERIQEKLKQLEPDFLEVVNESHAHKGHSGAENAVHKGESHFFVNIVSNKFSGLSIVEQHRLVYECLKEELADGVHALRLATRPSSN